MQVVSMLLLLVALTATVSAIPVSSSRDDIQQYLSSVYTVTPSASWTKLTDDEIYAFYDNLTFYYENNPNSPTWSQRYPSGRVQSHPYASTECDCLHIDLALCKNETTSSCPYWPLKTYLNMDFVMDRDEGFPSNVWFEGITFPGEWAFPVSCTDSSLERSVYAYHQHVWLYPATGFGVWFNTGNTASAANKVAWLLKYGQPSLGSTTTEVMDKLANTLCPNYQSVSSCEQCADPSDPTKCCCHGSGYNLGTQVVDVKSRFGLSTWDEALKMTAGFYSDGLLGQDDTTSYPKGTYFCIRDLLDYNLFNLGKHYDTLQFYREPQHSAGMHSRSSPAYAVEALAFNNDAYNWGQFCSNSQLGVIDPLPNKAVYLSQGYIPANKAKTSPISSWTPRPEFEALFQKSEK